LERIKRFFRSLIALRADNIEELFRPADRFTGVTHPEAFASIPDADDRKFVALAKAAGA
jgi:hypothetical protein